MNWAEVRADWEQFRIVLKSHWPELADAEIDRIDGQRPALIAALRRLGRSAPEAEHEVCEFEKDVRYPGAVK